MPFPPETCHPEEKRDRETLLAGDIVAVYEDPATCRKAEGDATLVQHVRDEPGYPSCQRWIVRFDDESEVERVIRTSDLLAR